MVNWINLSQNSGSSGTTQVTITASSSSELTARTASLTITGYAGGMPGWTDKTKTLTVNQAGTGTLVVEPSGIHNIIMFNGSGGTESISITTYMGNWTLTTTADWLSFSQTTGTTGNTIVTVTASASTLTSYRNATLTITDGDTTKQVYLRQRGQFSVSPTTLTFDSTGNSKTLTVSSYRDWVITGLPGWITASQLSGTNGTYSVTLTASENGATSRSGSFTVSNGDYSKTCTVSQPAQSLTDKYLTFDILSGGTIAWYATDTTNLRTIQYRINNGQWSSITASNYPIPTFNVSTSDKVEFKGTNTSYANYGFLRGSFASSTAKFNVSGNIMSLIDEDNFTTLKKFGNGTIYNFYGLFSGTSVVSASSLLLPATALTLDCYAYMFDGCELLTSPPELPATNMISGECYTAMFKDCIALTYAPTLPATTVEGHCYEAMFRGCTNLTIAPSLPATTINASSYASMFYGCTSLTTPPTTLPATIAYPSCYSAMFFGCTALTSAPSISATSLGTYCCQGMFQGCSSLTSAPELPATTLSQGCYSYMFVDCHALNYVKCLATDISASDCTYLWMSGTQNTGTFVKASGMNDWSRNNNGIPSGWTVQDAT